MLKTFTTVLAIAVLGCSDTGTSPKVDAAGVDSKVNPPGRDAPMVPMPPAIGTMIDRMGRPAVNTALNGLLSTVAADTTTMKDNYNRASNAATWGSTVLLAGTPDKTVQGEFMANLAILDLLDQGATGITAAGCGNQILYNNTFAGGGTPQATSYQSLASVLADDQLYVDTSKKTCTQYLSLELQAAGGPTHTQCGGRAPSHDVVDVTYSMLAAGVAGFSADGKLTPLITDGGGATKVSSHGDINDAQFPFLGAPNNP